MTAKPAHQRVLLKLSGEALMGDDAFGINRATIVRMVQEIAEVTQLGVEVAVVIGGGKVVVFAAGTGNPFFTTDTAAALRGAEIGADLVLKATKVDGVYTADPNKDPAATRYAKLTFDEAIVRNLGIMDATAFALCRDQKLPIRVFSIFKPGAFKRVILGEDEGTLVYA